MKHLSRDLAKLEKDLLVLATQVEGAVRNAMRSLLERRVDVAQAVIEEDREIDRREVDIEEDCLKILALHQPVATDLRFVAACLKIDNDLERIGDLACNIAKRSISLTETGSGPPPARWREMADVVAEMLRQSITAFVEADADASRDVCARDDLVDEWNRENIHLLLGRMHEDRGSIEEATELISVSKNLERIADHATNIAEDVIYLVEGDIVRHRMVAGGTAEAS